MTEKVVLTYDHSIQMAGRRISNEELADLPESWENPTVDTRKYYQCALEAWEVSETDYNTWKHAGGLCQSVDGRFYIA